VNRLATADLGDLRQSAPAMLAIADQVSADKWSGSGSWVAAYGRVRRFVALLPCTEAPTGAPTKQKAASMAEALRTWLGVSNVVIHPRFSVVQPEPEPEPEAEPEPEPPPEPEQPEADPLDPIDIDKYRSQVESLGSAFTLLLAHLAGARAQVRKLNEHVVRLKNNEQTAKLEAEKEELADQLSAARSEAEEAREALKELKSETEDLLSEDEVADKVEEAKEELLRELEPFFDLASSADPNRYDYLWRTMDLDEAIMARYPRLVS
jgi:hypothetical protein